MGELELVGFNLGERGSVGNFFWLNGGEWGSVGIFLWLGGGRWGFLRLGGCWWGSFLARWGWVGFDGDEWGSVGNCFWLGEDQWGSVGVSGGGGVGGARAAGMGARFSKARKQAQSFRMKIFH